MRFYTKEHHYYCGIDLHARTMYGCILNRKGETIIHRNIATNPEFFLETLAPFRDDIVVAVECMFSWYWLADLCAREDIPFVLGHALYMKAIHGAKVKNDRVDARKIAGLLKAGMIPMAYIYPRELRATWDLLRRRNYLARKKADLLRHIQNTNCQCNLPEFGRKITYKIHREAVAAHFTDPCIRRSIETDLELRPTPCSGGCGVSQHSTSPESSGVPQGR